MSSIYRTVFYTDKHKEPIVLYEGDSEEDAVVAIWNDFHRYDRDKLHDIYLVPGGGLDAETSNGKKLHWRLFASTHDNKSNF